MKSVERFDGIKGSGVVMIEVQRLAIPDVLYIKIRKFGDHRGFFSETYNKKAFHEAGIKVIFVQDNHSFSADVGTIRGLHFQGHPFAQDKLVRVVKGRIFHVSVDLRRASPTFGKHVAIEINSQRWDQVFVPVGFAHGFCTLEPNSEVIYKVSNYYAPQHEFGLLWHDPALKIDWPISADQAVLSDKDRKQPLLTNLTTYFE